MANNKKQKEDPNAIVIKRTIKLVDEAGNPTGDESKVEATFSHEFPDLEGDDFEEKYLSYFENEAAERKSRLKYLVNKFKQVAGTWVTSNHEDVSGIQEYMDDYVIPERSAAGRKKIYKVSSDQLKDAKVSAKNIAALAQLLGINVELDGEDV